MHQDQLFVRVNGKPILYPQHQISIQDGHCVRKAGENWHTSCSLPLVIFFAVGLVAADQAYKQAYQQNTYFNVLRASEPVSVT